MAFKIADVVLAVPPVFVAVAVCVPLPTGCWRVARDLEPSGLAAAGDGAVLEAEGEPETEAEGADSELPLSAVGAVAEAGFCAVGCWPVCGELGVELVCGGVGEGLCGVDVLASSKAAKDCGLEEPGELGSWLGIDVCIGDGGASGTVVAKSDAIPGIPDTRELLKAPRLRIGLQRLGHSPLL
ncbi:MAG: hypothetical protein WBB34_13545 [Xanthobacteraceae bacterium]